MLDSLPICSIHSLILQEKKYPSKPCLPQNIDVVQLRTEKNRLFTFSIFNTSSINTLILLPKDIKGIFSTFNILWWVLYLYQINLYREATFWTRQTHILMEKFPCVLIYITLPFTLIRASDNKIELNEEGSPTTLFVSYHLKSSGVPILKTNRANLAGFECWSLPGAAAQALQ